MRRVRFLASVFVLSVSVFTGCGPKLDPPVDTGAATEQLKVVFSAWKSGQPFDSLEQRSPAIYFSEALWRDGNTLLEYELGEVELFGRQGRCTVRLFLQGKDGKPLRSKDRLSD